MKGLWLVLAFVLLGVGFPLLAQESQLSLTNRFTALGIANVYDDIQDLASSLSWKPDLFGEYHFAQDWRLSAELSLDNHLHYEYEDQDSEQEWGFDLNLYRAWTALSFKETEIKAGLQHIRFGPAQIYRPLQWFDTLDPLSLLQDSEGVTALTLTHFFPNPELRLWSLLGTGVSKGQEEFPTKKGTVELGGRLSGLSAIGETGLSINHRVLKHGYDINFDAHEYRIGVDQRMDGFVGAWLEAVVNYLPRAVLPEADEGFMVKMEGPWYNGSATIGGDYTVGIGNGLYMLAECNYLWESKKIEFIPCKEIERTYSDSWHSALMLNYPLGILDGIFFVVSYDIYDDFFSRYNPIAETLSWRRTFDKLSWEIALGLSTTPHFYSTITTKSVKLTINYDI